CPDGLRLVLRTQPQFGFGNGGFANWAVCFRVGAMRSSSPEAEKVTETGAVPEGRVIPMRIAAAGARAKGSAAGDAIEGPSSLYRAGLWRMAVAVARRVPHFLLCHLAGHVAKAYWLSCPARRRVVFENVLPAVHGDERAA